MTNKGYVVHWCCNKRQSSNQQDCQLAALALRVLFLDKLIKSPRASWARGPPTEKKQSSKLGIISLISLLNFAN